MTLEESLTLPFNGNDLLPMEQVRQLVLTYAHSDPAKAPSGVVWRAMHTDLRSLFPPPPIGAVPPEFVPEAGSTQAFYAAVKKYAPAAGKLEGAAIKMGVPLEEQLLVRKYLEHWLPHKQIAGLCALVALCAGRRG